MDAEYLKSTVGGPLSEGLAQVAISQPDDPVEFLAHFLLKHDENQVSKAKVRAQC